MQFFTSFSGRLKSENQWSKAASSVICSFFDSLTNQWVLRRKAVWFCVDSLIVLMRPLENDHILPLAHMECWYYVADSRTGALNDFRSWPYSYKYTTIHKMHEWIKQMYRAGVHTCFIHVISKVTATNGLPATHCSQNFQIWTILPFSINSVGHPQRFPLPICIHSKRRASDCRKIVSQNSTKSSSISLLRSSNRVFNSMYFSPTKV